MNIVSLIMQYLGPVIISKLASSLGINQTIAQKIVTAALPAILGGLLGRVGKPGGAQALAEAVGTTDIGMLGKLGDLIGSPQQGKLAEQGLGTLGSLLGAGGLGALATAAAKFGGVNETASKGLIGMLAPAVLGTLGQQQKAAGRDAAGLGKMLLSQKDNIQAALPGDFAQLLGGSGLIDSISAPAKPAPAAPPVISSAPTPSSGIGLWRIAALALAVALAAWYFLGTGTPKLAELPKPPQIMVGGADIGGGLGKTMGGLQLALAGVRDKSSAEAALPRFRSAQGEIDRLSSQFGSLSAANKKSLASYVALALPVLLPMINKAVADSSFGPILKPILDQLVGKLQGMSKA